jgi:hypothetical protein
MPGECDDAALGHGVRHPGVRHRPGQAGGRPTRSYLIGIHLLDDDRVRHADGGGWYDCTLRRTEQGWRFVTVSLTEVWTAGEPLPHVLRRP